LRKPWPSSQNEAKNLNIFNACTLAHAEASELKNPLPEVGLPGLKAGRSKSVGVSFDLLDLEMAPAAVQ
jgi:hypothetical protein